MSKKSARKARTTTQVRAPAPKAPPRVGAARGAGLPRRWLYGGLAGIVVVVVIVVILVSVLGGGGGDENAPFAVDGGQTAALLDGIPQDGAVLGSPDAKVTLVEYGDLQCPFCQKWALDVLPTLVQDYVRSGDLRIEFRAIAFIGPDSEKALHAAYAAGAQNHLWNVVDLLYLNQGKENDGWVTDDLLRAIGAAIPGLDVSRMMDEIGSDAVAALAAEAQKQAATAGVQGTPTFQIGTTGGALKRLEVKSLTVDQFAPAIDQLLGQ